MSSTFATFLNLSLMCMLYLNKLGLTFSLHYFYYFKMYFLHI